MSSFRHIAAGGALKQNLFFAFKDLGFELENEATMRRFHEKCGSGKGKSVSKVTELLLHPFADVYRATLPAWHLDSRCYSSASTVICDKNHAWRQGGRNVSGENICAGREREYNCFVPATMSSVDRQLNEFLPGHGISISRCLQHRHH